MTLVVPQTALDAPVPGSPAAPSPGGGIGVGALCLAPLLWLIDAIISVRAGLARLASRRRQIEAGTPSDFQILRLHEAEEAAGDWIRDEALTLLRTDPEFADLAAGPLPTHISASSGRDPPRTARALYLRLVAVGRMLADPVFHARRLARRIARTLRAGVSLVRVPDVDRPDAGAIPVLSSSPQFHIGKRAPRAASARAPPRCVLKLRVLRLAGILPARSRAFVLAGPYQIPSTA